MKTFKQELKQSIDKIYCDMCGLSCTNDNFGTECATIEAIWGYNSKKDGIEYDIQLCERCFDETIEFIRHTRKQYLGPFKYPHDYDPLDGK